jgi:uncharacterized cupredoxin-like copper-binding protein
MRTPSHLSQAEESRRQLRPALLSKLLVLGLALLLVACAGATAVSNGAPAPTSTPTFPSSSGDQLVTIVEQSPVPGAVVVHVTEVEFAIISSITTFHPGIHYYFIVSNKGKQTHAFTFVPTYPDGKPMDEYYQYNHMLIGLDTIPPGTTQTINYTFKPADVGHYEMACRMRNHYMAGMHIPVVVV